MAEINFINGELRGRLGKIVGSSLHGKGYVKVFKKPGNPNTRRQQAVRQVFSVLSKTAGDIFQQVQGLPLLNGKRWNGVAYRNFFLKANKGFFDMGLYFAPRGVEDPEARNLYSTTSLVFLEPQGTLPASLSWPTESELGLEFEYIPGRSYFDVKWAIPTRLTGDLNGMFVMCAARQGPSGKLEELQVAMHIEREILSGGNFTFPVDVFKGMFEKDSNNPNNPMKRFLVLQIIVNLYYTLGDEETVAISEPYRMWRSIKWEDAYPPSTSPAGPSEPAKPEAGGASEAGKGPEAPTAPDEGSGAPG